MPHIKLFGDTNTKERLDEMIQSYVDPVTHLRNWVKGEVLGLESLIAAINYKDSIDTIKKKTVADIQDLTETINKLNAGKFTFGSMLKSDASKKESAVQKATVKAELEKDLINYDIIKKFLTIYLSTIAVPDFKKQRVQAYIRSMQRMSSDEIMNANNTLDTWSSFGQKIEQYNIK